MAIIKCKMCGGDVELSADKTIGVCEYCGSMLTFPKIDDEQRAAQFNRGNHFRRLGEFDKALSIYENIVRENDDDAEAHWCCALCRFGIEYVEDPASHEWLPTCHRASFDSFLEDVDYLAALEHSDGVTKRQYEKDAAKIAEVQKGILATSQKEEPFDVFICYKETDDSGQRTRDSMLAQDVYYQLTEKGYRVFFARITLEDKAGSEYEPYIFAALNSAKVMVCIGTKPEHFNAVWVKNEWSRYLALMRKDRKKLLLPCYRDMDPYDLPEQLSVLQSYDMSKIGFIQDLIRGVSKVVDAEKASTQPAPASAPARSEGGTTAEALLTRGEMALEDGDWKGAEGYYDRALDIDPKCAAAFLGKFLAAKQAATLEKYAQNELARLGSGQARKLTAVEPDSARIEATLERLYGTRWAPQQSRFDFDRSYNSTLASRQEQKQAALAAFDGEKLLHRARQFADEKLQAELSGARKALEGGLDARIAAALAEDEASIARVKAAYAAHLAQAEAQLEAEKRQQEEIVRRMKEAEARKRAEDYKAACAAQGAAKTAAEYRAAGAKLSALGDYEDSAARAEACKKRADALDAAVAAAAKRRKVIIIAVIAAAIVAVVAAAAVVKVIIPSNHYKKGEALLAAADYDGAVAEFAAAGDYSDAAARVSGAHYAQGEALFAAEDYDGAVAAFESAGSYSDAADCVNEVRYAQGKALFAAEDYDGAAEAFEAAGSYSDAADWVNAAYYAQGKALFAAEDYTGAAEAFEAARNYSDAPQQAESARNLASQAAHYSAAEALLAAEDYDGAIAEFEAAGDYSDAAERAKAIHYDKAEALLAAEDYDGAIAEFEAAGDFSDAAERLQVSYYNQAKALEDAGELARAAIAYGCAGEYADAAEHSLALWEQVAARKFSVAGGAYHTIGLKADGTAIATVLVDEYWRQFEEAGQSDVSDWTDIVSVSAGVYHTVGLKADGTVVAVGENLQGQCEVSGWTDIVAISAGAYHTVGLKSDGTAVATPFVENDYFSYYGQCDVSDWTDIVAIAAGEDHTVGLKSDGTVEITWVLPGERISNYGKSDVSDWTDIVAIAAGDYHTVGLKVDGTVVATGPNGKGQCNVKSWTDIVAIAAGESYTVGLKSDGTVVAVGGNYHGQCDVSGWKDIVAIAAGNAHTIGLKSDGTVVAVGDNVQGQCDVSDWTGIKLPG